MTIKERKHVVCQICGRQSTQAEAVPAAAVREALVEVIKASHPEWSPDGYICTDDLDRFRSEYVQRVLITDRGELTELERQVVESLKEEELLSKNINVEYDRRLTRGEKMADRLADFGGSWRFIGIFSGVLLLWVVLNAGVLIARPFDPYPFIFLNLILSCLAAVQAPVIMMSQNRQEAKDRLRAEHDFSVNLKAELEIRTLHEKVDHMLVNQWQRLLEIQEIQTELMQEIARHRHPQDK